MNNLLRANVHTVERVLRVGLGLVLIGLAATEQVGAWGYVGVVPLLTGVVGSCPIYSLLGISTCPTRTTRS